MSKNKAIKTCGECMYFNGLAHGFCKNKQGRLSVQVNDSICQNYKSKPTNGDKIRQMSDEELAEKLVYWVISLENGRMRKVFRSTVCDSRKFWYTEIEAIAATAAELKKVWKK